MSRTLDVYLHDHLAGTLNQDDDGQLSFAYKVDYLNDDSPGISVSLPPREEPYPDRAARPYFAGLLPDERARRLLASALGVSEGNAFGLLEIIGGESAGALSLVPSGEPLPDYEDIPLAPLPNDALAEILGRLRARPLLGGELGVRLSLAGAQDKIAVCLLDGQIALAKGGRPTSHILKPSIMGLEGTVENEVFCMRLATRMGLPAPQVSLGKAGKTGYFLVERYDRRIIDGKAAMRLHQEDFCQALGVPPELKYESEGGPGTETGQSLIQDHASRPAADRITFQRMLIFHYLVGNADAHGKNYALLYNGRAPDLAPLYDVVCTAAYPNLAKPLAMTLGGRNLADTIQLRHWLTLVPDTKPAQRLLTNELAKMAEKIGSEADQLLEELRADEIDHPIFSSIRKIIATRAQLIQRAINDADG